MKLDDCTCKVLQIYCLDENGNFGKRALFLNTDNSLKGLLKKLKSVKGTCTNIYEMKGCYYAD